MNRVPEFSPAAAPLAALYLLGYLFIALPLLDMLTGYLVLGGHITEGSVGSPSQLGRLLAILALIFWIRKMHQWLTLTLVVAYGVAVEAVSAIYHSNTSGFLYGMVVVYKLAYPIILLFFLQQFMLDRGRVQLLNKFFATSLIIISVSLFLAAIFGFGYKTYGSGSGVKGYFSSGNTLGLYLGFGSLYLATSKRYGLTEIGNLSLWFLTLSVLLVGTKTAFIFAATTTAVLIANVRRKSIMIPALCLGMIGVLSVTWQSLIKAFDVVLWRLDRSESFISFLGSGRIDYVFQAFSSFLKQDVGIFRLAFGAGGYVSFRPYDTTMPFDALETDLFDLFFMYGSVALLAYIAVLSVAAFRLKGRLQLMGAFILLAGHSIIAGHTLYSGLMSACLSMCVALSSYHYRMNAKND